MNFLKQLQQQQHQHQPETNVLTFFLLIIFNFNIFVILKQFLKIFDFIHNILENRVF